MPKTLFKDMTARLCGAALGLALLTCAGVETSTRRDGGDKREVATPGGFSPIGDVPGMAADAPGADVEPAGDAFAAGDLLAGVATEDITPQWPMIEAFLETKVSEHYHNLEVSALAVSDGKTPLVFVTSDACIFCNEVSDRIYARVKPLGLEPQQVFLNGSHNHTGPALCTVEDVVDPRDLDRKYQSLFIDKVVRAITRAMADLRPAALSTAEGTTDICVNRNGGPRTRFSLIPDPAGPIDKRVHLLAVRDPQSRQLRAVLTVFGCHPSDIGGGSFGAEFFGFARDELGKRFPGATVLTAQGSGGDVRLAHYKNDDIKQGFGGTEITDLEPNRAFGRRFAAAIADGLAKGGIPFRGRIRTTLAKIPLPIEPDSREIAERAAMGMDPDLHASPWIVRWGKHLLDTYYDAGVPVPRSVGPYAVRVTQIGDDLTVAALDGEIFTCIARQIEQALVPAGSDRRTMIMGFTNDDSAYIPCRSDFFEGQGGMSVNIYYWWLQPGRFEPTIDSLIVGKTVELAQQLMPR